MEQAQVDYVIDANKPINEIGKTLLEMISGTTAEVRNEQTTVFLEKSEPVSYVTGGPTGLIALKVTNFAAPFKPHCADTILQASRTIANDNWADHVDFQKNGQWFRGIYFKPKEE
jgi:hypothetical protein